MTLASIVSVSIQAGTANVSQRGFGTPLILGWHTRFAENVKTYTGLSGMIADGFTVNDPVYKMAAAIFSQSPRPERIKVGRLPTPGTPHTVEIDCTGAVSGDTIAMTVTSPDGTETDISVPFNTSATQTGTDLAADLDAISGLAASSAAGVVTADADNNGEMFFYADITGPAEILDVTADWAYDTQLAAILNDDADFFTVCIDVNSDANIADVAAWAAANKRIAFFAPQVTNAADYTATANPLRTGNNDNAASLAKRDSRAAFADCARVGEALPFPPGSQTWAFKQPTGVLPDNWSASDLVTLETDNTDHATEVGSQTMIRWGLTHGGEYIDVVRGLYWLEARIQERIANLLLNNRKIPYTASGLQQIATEIRAQLKIAVQRGVIAEDSWEVTVPAVADIPPADRTARHVTGIEFTGVLAGAVHKVTIAGTVSV